MCKIQDTSYGAFVREIYTCAQDKISCGTFIRGAHGSACVQNNIFMTRSHVEHIGSTCVQDRTSLLACPLVTHKFFD